MTAGLATYNRDQSRCEIAVQLLIYPVLDHRLDSASWQIDAPRRTFENLIAIWCMYLKGGSPVPSAVIWVTSILVGLPSTFLTVDEFDIFLEDERKFVCRSEQCGVQTPLCTYPGVFHAAELHAYETNIDS